MRTTAERSGARLLWIALSATLAVALVSGCGSGGLAGAGGQRASAPKAQVRLEPGGGSDVNPKTPVKASVREGRLDHVALLNPDGEPVDGRMSPDGKTWTAGEKLGYDKDYTWTGTATGPDGESVPVRGSFSTLEPAEKVRATINPTDGAEVGVAMPVSVKFDSKVEDKAAAERALKVETSVPVEGSWAWVSDRQVDYRPKEYWPADTHVRVEADLYGVSYGSGAHGASDVSTDFTVGRNQVVKADAGTHQLVVERDGRQVASYPASYGLDGDPERNTPNGTYTVMEKNPVEIMDNPRYGYTDVEKTWAVRISNHGEFIHENDENAANLGKKNNSHGCINLGGADAKEYFDGALLGDPVEVTGGVTGMPPHYAIFDWLLSWQQWTAKSALR